jgi:hypothetical protein
MLINSEWNKRKFQARFLKIVTKIVILQKVVKIIKLSIDFTQGKVIHNAFHGLSSGGGVTRYFHTKFNK